MRIVLTFLLALASGGFVLSLLTHVFALLEVPQPLGEATIWLVAPLLLVMWSALIVSCYRLRKDYESERTWYAMVRGSPRWMRDVLHLVTGYGVIHILFDWPSGPPAPPKRPTPPWVYEYLSLFWMVLYAWSAVVMRSAITVLKRGRLPDT